MERQNKLSIEMWDTASTIPKPADITSARTNSTAASNINTINNFAVTSTTASIVAVTTTTASIVSVTTSTASNFVAATRTMVSTPVTIDHPRRGRGFIPRHGHFRNLGGFQGYSFREIERKMGGSSNQMLLSQVLQHWRKDVQKYYNPPLPGKRSRKKRGGQYSQGQRGLGGHGRRGGRGGQGGTGGMTI
ncbi:uncharacterized protein LOC100571613 [Acyrthosiphon pisum]|uniref:Uncharacterized protein n=1 Tax=Acyrthosiphon pisum TaxID=7029 RepID=A0A8R2A597_ACYPI|nr:uncharacterized protein LOC100571613 [Acyrthosiphon pisum]|eukprot:XP_003241649.1 PREDICTED: uncharacterized protein LOC100571613 [Acyrthosiphon pisum]